ncbi:calcium permeable stress-gated cation channel 1 like protein [Babesia gibsoni]|uniref:Calcium permeable stress-gated cation channel 1 like protein n=1 Tax=Babesia gibsoni TaxID=33632 RepID=A0AAD8PGI5_BABGI|nr:calcium permeable stress-gated cation channel 1 like protein [Babesia gibsoni]
MNSELRNFIIIITVNIAVFLACLYIWTAKRRSLIRFLHTGFSGLLLKYYKKQNRKHKRTNPLDNVDQVEVKRPYLFGKDEDSTVTAANKVIGRDEFVRDGASDGNAMHFNNKDSEETMTTHRIYHSQPNPQRVKKKWWYYLTHLEERRIRNNEAVLYLRFMKSTCMMLVWCSLVAILTNTFVYIHLKLQSKSYFITTYRIEDLLNCKVTMWALYCTTWIYSFIVYIYILKFRSMVNRGEQITVILRPQLHTIMISGFEKTITDPGSIYKYFDKCFPEHILSVHVVVNHTKRMSLEEELDATKAQLTLCRDMSLVNPKLLHDSRPPSRAESELSLGNETPVKPKRCPEKIRTSSVRCHSSTSSGVNELRNKFDKKAFRRSRSSAHIKLFPPRSKNSHQKEPKEKSIQRVKKVASIFYRGKNEIKDKEEEPNHHKPKDDRFTKLLKRIKELRVQIDEEVERKHTTSARVCFVSFADPNLVLHILKDRSILEDMPTWRICPAPHPRDIVWKNIHLPRWYIMLRVVLYNLLLTAFYVVITWIISQLNLLYTVTHVAEDVEGITETTIEIKDVAQRSLWNTMMPPLVMAMLNSCVHPTMINTVSRQMGFWTQSTYQKYLLFCHVFYLITSTILIPLLASMLTFWKIFDGAFDSLSIDLGKVLISTSWRFSTIYIFNATFIGSSNQLLQITQIGFRLIWAYFFKYDIGTYNFDFGYWYAFHLSILTLVMLFRYNIVHEVLQLPLDSTGKISASAVKSMLLCISITQFAMSGVFLNCQHVLPPLCITLLYIASVATLLLLYASNSDTMVETTEALHRLKLKPLSKSMMDTIKLCYMHPCDCKDFIESRSCTHKPH